ncbi:Alpha-1,3-mannosyltransferase-like protein [Thecaphora frezii]
MSQSRPSARVVHSVNSPVKKLRIGFIHPDLGIGGAEKFIVDAAVSLQQLGHEVVIFTSHHDPKHCFEATRDGTLKVQVMKTFIPRSLFHSLHLPMAILQQFSLIFQLILSVVLFKYPGTMPRWLARNLTSSPPIPAFDLFFIDQLSAGIPWIKILLATRILYYCHFPDKDIGNSIAMQKAIARGQSGPSIFRKVYRLPLDLLEESTTDYADKILVNSDFTSKQFVKSFYRLRRQPRTLYPGVDVHALKAENVQVELDKLIDAAVGDRLKNAIIDLCCSTDRLMLFSINRFEAKKNVALALESFAVAQKQYAADGKPGRLRLVLAGGYDRRVRDNIETLNELQKQASELGLKHLTLSYNGIALEPPVSPPSAFEISQASVIFLPSLPGPLLHTLLLNHSTRMLLYTPTEEHFGIVPLEAMICGVPVLATNTGGPVETVVDLAFDVEGWPTNLATGTGLLRHASASIWAASIVALLELDEEQRRTVSQTARQRVQQTFSLEKMSEDLEKACYEVYAMGHVKPDEGLLQWASTLGIFFVMATLFVVNVYYSNDRLAARKQQQIEALHRSWKEASSAAASASGSS